MWSIVKFEFKNFFKDIKNYVPIIALMLIICIFVFKNIEYENASKNLRCKKLQDFADSIELEYNQKINMGIPQDDPNLKNLQIQCNLTNKLRLAISKRDAKKYLNISIEWCKHNISMIDKGNRARYMKDKIYYEALMKQNEFMLKNNIEPMDESCSMSGLNFLRLSGNSIPFVIILAVFVYIGSSAYASEVQYKTYKLLYTQPVKKIKIFMGKLMGKFIISLLSIIAILCIFTLVLGSIKGFGTLKYPTTYVSGDTVVIVSMWYYLAKQALLLVVLILFVNLLGMIVSMFIGNVATSLITTMVIIFMGYIIGNINSISYFTKYLPFSCLQPLKVLGGVKIVDGFTDFLPELINFNFAICITFLYCILLFFVGIFIVSNKKHMKEI